MSSDGQTRNSEPNVAASFAGLSHDVIELAELQAELLALDVKDTSQGARSALILSAVGIAVLLGSVPVGLITLAVALIEQRGWSHIAGFGAATVVGVLLSTVILATAWTQLRAGVVSLHRSQEEFRRNIAWIKSSLRSRAQRNPAENI
jgi:hypothetical protein